MKRSDFDRGMIVGARQGGLNISETGFSCTTVFRAGVASPGPGEPQGVGLAVCFRPKIS